MAALATLWVRGPPEKYFAGALSGSSPARKDGETRELTKKDKILNYVKRSTEIREETVFCER